MLHSLLKSFSVTAALSLLLAPSLLAQGGSNYSAFGIGDIRYNAGAAYDAIGGTSIAVPLVRGINLLNPAAWSYTHSTRLQAGYRFNQSLISNSQSSISQNNGKIDGILAIFSIDTARGISASFGIQPYSSVNYLSASTFAVEADTSVKVKRELIGAGGLSTAYLGASFMPFKDLALGANAFAIFGTINSTIRSTILGQNYSISTNEVEDGFRGVGGRFGAMYSVTPEFIIGATAAVFSDLDLTSTLTYYSSTTSPSVLNPDTSFITKSTVVLPAEFGIGASYRTGQYLFSADAEMQDFSGGFAFRPQSDQTVFRRAMRMSAGIARIGNFRAGSSYFDKVGYGIGGGFKQLYYQVNGESIDELYGSFGLQLPIAGAAELDAALTGGIRGTTNAGLVEELFMRASFSVSIGETWFKPFAR
ncbi:MAG: hypothetical protein V4642_05890 [Bacteroidota bacterium]